MATLSLPPEGCGAVRNDRAETGPPRISPGQVRRGGAWAAAEPQGCQRKLKSDQLTADGTRGPVFSGNRQAGVPGLAGADRTGGSEHGAAVTATRAVPGASLMAQRGQERANHELDCAVTCRTDQISLRRRDPIRLLADPDYVVYELPVRIPASFGVPTCGSIPSRIRVTAQGSQVANDGTCVS
jgi:hypothetical protein